jgi:hypothetical protein
LDCIWSACVCCVINFCPSVGDFLGWDAFLNGIVWSWRFTIRIWCWIFIKSRFDDVLVMYLLPLPFWSMTRRGYSGQGFRTDQLSFNSGLILKILKKTRIMKQDISGIPINPSGNWREEIIQDLWLTVQQTSDLEVWPP